MDKDILINKLALSVTEYKVPLKVALEQAYAAGRSKKGIPINGGKNIIQYNRNGVEIDRFVNAEAASRKLGVCVSSIYRAVKFNRVTRAGHIWKYAEV